ncbi:MAG: nucleotide exchange factor GrpE [Myxococcaceae bacterium]|nr:nucleotide exchange factor GrpE [Myxococcaceae bacterium]MBH2006534.1 nucleotide exchange factor GrpE [Myxococcaceae bacterium]
MTENPEIVDIDKPENSAAQDNSEFQALQERYLRLYAEFDNFKKRSEKDRQISVRFASESLLKDLLPVLDHLEQAVSAATGASSVDAISEGVRMVLKQFEDTLGRYGITSFSAIGSVFDPMKHEAMAEQADSSVPAGQVLAEYQKGYLLNERLVRPARVVVAKSS